MTKIPLDKANHIIRIGLDYAREQGMKPLCIVVLDPGGHVIAAQRQDGCGFLRPRVATAKASGALAIGQPSRRIGEVAARDPNFLTGMTAISPNGMIAAAGGVIVLDAEGEILGAVGVSGDSQDNDEACALVGIQASGLAAHP